MTSEPAPGVASDPADSLRALMPALANKTYFNYGGQGPLPTPALEAMTACWRRIQELGPFTGDVWPFLAECTGQLRGRLAAACGVAPHRIALTENVTSGCVLPLWGLPWRPGDELLIGDCEHPGVVAACLELARREGLSCARLPVRDLSCRFAGERLADALLEALEARLTPNTRLVVLSHLLWNTGALLPIDAVAATLARHPGHPWLLVDAAQSMGSLPVAEAAAAADIYAFTGHKWCCGPEGLGGVALSERLLGEARPTLIGWRSLAAEGVAEAPWHRDARRFEVATSCVPLTAGLCTSLELLEAAGDRFRRLERIRHISGRLWQGLRQIDGIHTLLEEPPPAGLVSFVIEGEDPDAMVARLGSRGLWLRSLEDPACLRACTHVTTTEEEVDHLIGTLRLEATQASSAASRRL